VPRISLSLSEAEYLLRREVLPDSLSALVRDGIKIRPELLILELTDEQAGEFEDLLRMKMVQVGFDQNYHLNRDGEILESLADRFLLL
jgi:hypothetical protein